MDSGTVAAWVQAGAGILSLGAVYLLGRKQNKLVEQQNAFVEAQREREKLLEDRLSKMIRRLLLNHLDHIVTAIESGVNDGRWNRMTRVPIDTPIPLESILDYLNDDGEVTLLWACLGGARAVQENARTFFDRNELDRMSEQNSEYRKIIQNFRQLMEQLKNE